MQFSKCSSSAAVMFCVFIALHLSFLLNAETERDTHWKPTQRKLLGTEMPLFVRDSVTEDRFAIDVDSDGTVADLRTAVKQTSRAIPYLIQFGVFRYQRQTLTDETTLADVGLGPETTVELELLLPLQITAEQCEALLPRQIVRQIRVGFDEYAEEGDTVMESIVFTAHALEHGHDDPFSVMDPKELWDEHLPHLSNYFRFALLERAICSDEDREREETESLSVWDLSIMNDLSDDWFRMLIDARWNVNAKHPEYPTALMSACDDGRTKVIEMLVDAGADVAVRHDSETAWRSFQKAEERFSSKKERREPVLSEEYQRKLRGEKQ